MTPPGELFKSICGWKIHTADKFEKLEYIIKHYLMIYRHIYIDLSISKKRGKTMT